MGRRLFIAFAAAAVLVAGAARAQQVDFSKVEVKTTDLGHGTYMLEGPPGGNITFAVGADGVILVDGSFAPLHDKIVAAVRRVTDLPIRYVVNTHYHGDHTGGNAGFAKDRAEVVGHVNLRKRLAEGTLSILSGNRTPPAPEEALPAKTYKTSMALRVKGRTAQVRHIANAHTDGDTYVYFADANVLSTGDIVTVGNRYPVIDVPYGGSIRGMIAGTDIYLKLANGKTKIVPGHGPLLDKAALADYRKMLVTARDRVAKLIAAHKTEEEAVAAKPLADMDAKAGATAEASNRFVLWIYRSLKKA